jgi:hypothetical protein
MKQKLQINQMPQSIKYVLLSALFGFTVIHGVIAQDIKKEQVRFEKGANSATIEASITGDETIDYMLNVKKGQYINVSMATDNGANYFNVMEPNEEYEAIFNGSINENQYEGVLQKSGNYTIRVYLMRSAARRNEKANYRLEMIVTNKD